MATRAEAQQPNPAIIFETLNAYQNTAALKTGIELDIFTAIGEGTNTAAELAGRCATSERGMRILCDYLTILGFLTKQGNRYGLTPDSAMFLDRRSPACLASVTMFLASSESIDASKQLTAAVRKGGSMLPGDGSIEPDNPIWVKFARGMAPMMAVPAEQMARLLNADSGQKWKVLDIAAGHGLFGVTLAKHNPNAEIFAVDWKNVLEVAKENAEKAGVGARHHGIPGSAFDVEFGSGYDLVLLTNFLHHFDAATNEKLLRKVHAALAPGGRAVVLEFVPNDDRVTPRVAAGFSMIMLNGTPSGDAYTFAEFERMFRAAGYSGSELHALPPTFQNVIISQK